MTPKCDECALESEYEVHMDIRQPDGTHVKFTVQLCYRHAQTLPAYKQFRQHIRLYKMREAKAAPTQWRKEKKHEA